MPETHPSLRSPIFATTRWSVVIAAQQEPTSVADEALETLCRTYWYPLYAYVRRAGHSAHDAQDLTQEFFARLLAKEWLNSADRGKGRFRSFLLVAMKRFLAKEWHREHAQKARRSVSLRTDQSRRELRNGMQLNPVSNRTRSMKGAGL
jgi:RNA polymerase sigma-70 factor (ECF subfamily)